MSSSALPWPSTLREINDLPEPAKRAIYCTLVPDWLLARFGIDRQTLTVGGKPVIEFHCPGGSRTVELTVRHCPDAQDPVFYLHLANTLTNQLSVLMLVINDPASPRFSVDVDEHGHSTRLGATGRNIPEEIRALEYGLAPGQVRLGLRRFRSSLPDFEAFVRRLGYDLFLIEPLYYHNAVTFERYGFTYMRGRLEMERINAEFQPGGCLYARLDGSTPFRSPEAWKTIRGRSWAIHDGILGHLFSDVQMYKRMGRDAGISTFPGAAW